MVGAGRFVSPHGLAADRKPFHVKGEYLTVDPPRTLEFTWVAGWSGDLQTIVRSDLSPHQDGTLVKIQHTGFAAQPEQATNHSQGWPSVLAWMQTFVKKGENFESRVRRAGSPLASPRLCPQRNLLCNRRTEAALTADTRSLPAGRVA
jgi:hypothetical protein